MRNILSLLLILLLAGVLFAEDAFRVSDDMTLREAATAMRMPVKKLMQHLDLPDSAKPSDTIAELGIQQSQLEEIHTDFHGNLMGFCTSLTVIGMTVVFLSLIVTGMIISQIRHLNKAKKKAGPTKTVETSIGKISGPQPDISTNAIVAVITALHMHIAEAEERQKLILTWKRAPLSLWRGSSRNAMPNQTYFQAKGRS